jgi:hypothetical protein
MRGDVVTRAIVSASPLVKLTETTTDESAVPRDMIESPMSIGGAHVRGSVAWQVYHPESSIISLGGHGTVEALGMGCRRVTRPLASRMSASGAGPPELGPVLSWGRKRIESPRKRCGALFAIMSPYQVAFPSPFVESSTALADASEVSSSQSWRDGPSFTNTAPRTTASRGTPWNVRADFATMGPSGRGAGPGPGCGARCCAFTSAAAARSTTARRSRITV